MNRPFLFLSGEFRISMPLVFTQDNWQHTMSPDCLVSCGDRKVRRKKYVQEKLDGVIFYADMDDKELEYKNLSTLLHNNIPCWPDPYVLASMLNRHAVLSRCVKNGFVNHPVVFTDQKVVPMDFPFVLKVGNNHRGIGKYLIESQEDLELVSFDGYIVTYEPFFKGISVRILLIDHHAFGIKIDNKQSWIANSPGAEISLFEPTPELVKHARNVTEEFGLQIAGIDYILNKSGFHFLEINQYPGLDVDDSVTPLIRESLIKKMRQVEKQA